MPETDHHHPGQAEARSYGQTHHEDRVIDLNTASEDELSELPMVGPDRVRAIMEARPFSSWEDVEAISGFGKGMIDNLKSGGAEIGSGKPKRKRAKPRRESAEPAPPQQAEAGEEKEPQSDHWPTLIRVIAMGTVACVAWLLLQSFASSRPRSPTPGTPG